MAMPTAMNDTPSGVPMRCSDSILCPLCEYFWSHCAFPGLASETSPGRRKSWAMALCVSRDRRALDAHSYANKAERRAQPRKERALQRQVIPGHRALVLKLVHELGHRAGQHRPMEPVRTGQPHGVDRAIG